MSLQILIVIAKHIAAAFICYYSWTAALEIVKSDRPVLKAVHACAYRRLFKLRKFKWWLKEISFGILFGIVKKQKLKEIDCPFSAYLSILFVTHSNLLEKFGSQKVVDDV